MPIIPTKASRPYLYLIIIVTLDEFYSGMSDKFHRVVNFNNMSIEKLIDYIISTHHVSLKKALESLPKYFNTIKFAENEKHIDVESIKILFEELITLLGEELKSEETLFFPYIKKLVEIEKNNELTLLHLKNLSENKVKSVQSEQRKIKEVLKKIRKITNEYYPSANSSPGLKLCYAQLFNLEQDIQKHIFLQENLVFPKLLELEKRIINSKKN